MPIPSLFVTFAAILACASATAATVAPIAYAAPNGDSVDDSIYHDESHSQYMAGMADNVLLAGGVGDLTDGVIADQPWITVEPPAGPGPYVGWVVDGDPAEASVSVDPLRIDFTFDETYRFTRVSLYGDHSNGVEAPASLTVWPTGDKSSAQSASFPSQSGLYALSLSLAPEIAASALSLEIDLAAFTMLSEVTFGVVPVPPALPLLAGGLAALGLAARRRLR